MGRGRYNCIFFLTRKCVRRAMAACLQRGREKTKPTKCELRRLPRRCGERGAEPRGKMPSLRRFWASSPNGGAEKQARRRTPPRKELEKKCAWRCRGAPM